MEFNKFVYGWLSVGRVGKNMSDYGSTFTIDNNNLTKFFLFYENLFNLLS